MDPASVLKQERDTCSGMISKDLLSDTAEQGDGNERDQEDVKQRRLQCRVPNVK